MLFKCCHADLFIHLLIKIELQFISLCVARQPGLFQLSYISNGLLRLPIPLEVTVSSILQNIEMKYIR